jgi:hypothetical protein
MSQKVEVTIVSDLSGEPGAHGLEFGFEGVSYQLDVTEAEHQSLKDSLSAYLDKASKVSGGRGRPKSASRPAPVAGSGGSGLTKEERQAVREFAAANGHTLAQRGRLPEVAIMAWREQNPEILASLSAA